MKKIFKHLVIILLVVGLAESCETTDLDGRVSPNDLSVDQADPNLLLNAVQLAYATNQQTFSDNAAALTRIDYFFGRDYFNQLPGTVLNGAWSRTYSSNTSFVGDVVSVGILTNLQALESIDANTDVDYSFHIGVAKTLYAHSLFQLVDFLGQAAFSQAGQPLEFPAPSLDSGEEVYAAAFNLLDEAEALLAGNPSAQGATDLFYDEDSSKWVKLINTLRLRSYKNTGNKAAFDAIIAGGNYISSTADDFQLQYGTSELQPDTRHPDYAQDYTPSGANIYQSNWLMELMLDNDDPRIRYYFYRQSNGTPGALDVNGDPVDPNEETLACSLVVPPQHYLDGGYTYCSVDNGYWGRSHGNDEGTPPDNFLRTAVGVYPAGGLFDDSEFNDEGLAPGVGLGAGGGGAGIEPIILASYVDFWIGEMATSDSEKAAALQAGLEKSIAKVQSFGSLDGSADLSLAPSETDVDDYITGIVDAFNAATGDDKENIFAEQYFVTLYGGGTESYNYYRKTGYPTTVLPNWELNPGPFPRTFLYPQNEVVTNPNLEQRTALTEQVFWDTNPASPTFPPAN
ncbi:SusD/RagB family nutrient-binding outer membrane lipoprotein [Flavobacteriaceae bacterium TP-CH-4]|uniref:SusD/RagB family nutrient-binding outer membrane lipoprotein n=1 Tax=Pelagihabitans pacificus TaxID=2696054 RepID=A0A967AQ17_9FLAO|nr:SusD/RagB family nutrient-binding outer membrane lipoprotein [Pelagihabitans pacificus]NHF58244.1 SusD/RagB family nutrient-binding outer membrane lipoprotein [Pelagihabitans pacificus]